MIGRLKGKLLEKQAPQLLVDVQGVGYEVAAPMTTFYRLPDIGGEVVLYTHFVVREDAQLLYGFSDTIERALFRALIKVNGVGPKMALAILSGIETEAFIRCVHDNDTATLIRVPGIGKKTAERLIIEMRDRLQELGELPASTSSGDGIIRLASASNHRQDAISALEALGYKAQEASRAVAAVKEDGLSSEELIRSALKAMAK